MKFILTLLMSSSLAFAADCEYSISAQDFKVDWKAYKTPLKVGVGGKFTQLGTSNEKGKSLKELLEGIQFNIDTNSTNTGNPDRDKKIIKHFFQNMDGNQNIAGETISFAKKVLTIRFTMNKVTRDIPLKVTTTKDSIQAKGVIDVLDFTLNKSLMGINKACEKLHEGKTWSDVEINLSAKYSKKC